VRNNVFRSAQKAGVKFFLSLFCLVTPAFCQLVSVGVKAGVPLTDAFSSMQSSFTYGTRRYVVGGTAELHLPFRFSVELDALYRRIGFDYRFQSLDIGHFLSRTTANQWDFPLLVKYEVLRGPIRPFVDAGPVLRHLSGITETSSFATFFPFQTGSTVSNSSLYLRNRNSPGFAIGGGVTAKLFRLRLSPEIRYIRWSNEAFQGENGGGTINSNLNQLDLMVGFAF